MSTKVGFVFLSPEGAVCESLGQRPKLGIKFLSANGAVYLNNVRCLVKSLLPPLQG
ncbi:hypothetical protein HUU05_05870 [candidate division KSB1 bacterium]|nr:hypothetical protein [candidate division KSB1 bacterium]